MNTLAGVGRDILLAADTTPYTDSGTVAQNLGWAILFSLVGGLLGIVLVLLSTLFLPRVIDRLTPNLDEEKEIARGNVAVAEYFGRVVSACILGISLVMAAAILGGILAGLH